MALSVARAGALHETTILAGFGSAAEQVDDMGRLMAVAALGR
ncbi:MULTISPECIES: hypothetical protein [Sphingomonadales]|nr:MULTISPECIES: hypothetical protein [Sphingomonas]MDX3884096.1 hypothetical protein [Sphingomonas sp.]